MEDTSFLIPLLLNRLGPVQVSSARLMMDYGIKNTIRENAVKYLERLEKREALISELAESFPKAYRHALTQKSIRMLLSNERRTVRQFVFSGILSGKDAEPLLEHIDERADKLNTFRNTTIGTLLRHLFKK